jgi:hypothetical protein
MPLQRVVGLYPARACRPTTGDCLPTRLLSVGAGALTPVPPPVPGEADRRLPSGLADRFQPMRRPTTVRTARGPCQARRGRSPIARPKPREFCFRASGTKVRVTLSAGDSNSWSRFEKTPFNTRHKVACPSGRQERHHSEWDQKFEAASFSGVAIFTSRVRIRSPIRGRGRARRPRNRGPDRRTREMPG